MTHIKSYSEAVTAIKEAILRSQFKALSAVNREQLSLYYGIGQYVSQNSRDGFWGTGAIEQISQTLQKELPGLRGFSAANMKKMRTFYEAWAMIVNRSLLATDLQEIENQGIINRSPLATDLKGNENLLLSANRQPVADDLQSNDNLTVINRPPVAGDLKVDEKLLLSIIRQPQSAEFDWEYFMRIGFSHHIEILNKTTTLDARLFYIRECAVNFWSKYTLRDYLRSDLYNKRGTLPNNFAQTMPDVKQALKAIGVFKDEYLVDYVNVELLCENEKDWDERVIEKSIVANIKKNHTFVQFAVRDYTKPMGVATYRTSEEMPEKWRKALPDIDEMKKLL